jgi:TRAP-type mannitol/chloroaromatic compound transport system permease small subunit
MPMTYGDWTVITLPFVIILSLGFGLIIANLAIIGGSIDRLTEAVRRLKDR